MLCRLHSILFVVSSGRMYEIPSRAIFHVCAPPRFPYDISTSFVFPGYSVWKSRYDGIFRRADAGVSVLSEETRGKKESITHNIRILILKK